MTSTLKDTKLYKQLDSMCHGKDIHPLDPERWLGGMKQACEELGSILNRACINFEDYTLHDAEHAVRVIDNMHRLIGHDGCERLNVVEITLLILSAFAHDAGMAVGRERREQLRKEDGYKLFLLENEATWLEAERARESGNHERFEALSSQLFQEYLRARHHRLSEELVSGELRDLFKFQEKSLASPLASLCRSHGEPIEFVTSLPVFPFAGQFRADLQFIACVLRLADYLELDSTRAPKSLFHLIKPGTEVARREWRKSQASNFFIGHDRIEFQAEFSDFHEEKVLRDTIAGIDRERTDCMELLRKRLEPGAHRLLLDARVEQNIRSHGYVYEEFQFQLEYREIMSLLMGVRLYKDERVFIRELLQNALDACRHSDAAALASGRGDYHGRIVVRLTEDRNGQVLEVSDNGAGMTRSVIEKYFMRVGRSYYESFAFRQKGLPFHAVSQFGIGILSCFMQADHLEVETRPDPIVYAGESDDELKARMLDIRGPHEFFVVREIPQALQGTTVRLFLRKHLVESLSSLVERFVGRIPYRIEIVDHDKPPLEPRKLPLDFTDEQFSLTLVSSPGEFGYKSRDLEFKGRLGFEMAGGIRFFLLDANGRRYLKLHDTGQYSSVGFSAEGEAVVVVKQLSSAVRTNLDQWLVAVRVERASLPIGLWTDLDAIVHNVERVCDELMAGHHTEEVNARWASVRAQIDTLQRMQLFQSSPACVRIERALARVKDEVHSFVSGQLTLWHPPGILTQDGINLSGMMRLPPKLRLGIGYQYNLDLCGEHRVSLNAARDDVLQDGRLTKLITHLHDCIGPFLGEWFREESVTPGEVTEYFANVPRRLAENVSRTYTQPAAAVGRMPG